MEIYSRELREGYGAASFVSQDDLAAALNRSQMWISLVESGKVKPSAEVLQRMRAAVERIREFRRAMKAAAHSLPSELEICGDLRL